MQDYRKLKVFEKADGLVIAICQVTGAFPRNELYGLTSQIRRASVSIPANIVEGCGRSSNAEFCQFLQISLGSAQELEYYIHLAAELKLLNKPDSVKLGDQSAEVKSMLIALIKRIKANS